MLARRAVLALSLLLGAAAGTACVGQASEGRSAVPLATATPDEPTADDDTGTLEILCNPPVQALVDGKPAGTTPVVGFKVAPGSHDVTCVDEQGGNRTMTIKVGPGEGRTVTSDRAPSLQERRPEKKR
jgi:hypothetical protein